MQLHVQTTIFMICMAYLVLHAAIWFALSEQRNHQVRLWCVSGLLSGVAVVLLSLRDVVGEFTFIFLGQLLMVVGNIGRMIALRMYLPDPIRPAIVFHGATSVIFFLWFLAAYEAGTPDQPLALMFFGFYTFVCFDYFLVGWLVHLQSQTLGPRVLMLGGLTLSGSLGFKTVVSAMGYGAPGIYEPGIDQYVMIAGQFIAITLVNIGFLRIFLDLREQKNLQTERNLAAAEERASLFSQHKSELQNLLTEREEIIRQLTLSNKTAGMGALVASLAHELNQPLCAIRLNAQLVERKLEEPEADVLGARKFLDSVIQDNRRAANIITKLRGMFETHGKEYEAIDFDMLVVDTLSLVQPHAKAGNITVDIHLNARSVLQGDATQLQQVILNLLNNALESLSDLQQQDKRIVVKTDIHAERIRLDVSDNGPGIPDALQPSVFELFKTSKAEGMGVGLWLSKTVINAHRGDIRFYSSPDNGTRFEVDLPLN